MIRIAPVGKSRRSASLESIPRNLQIASPANPPALNKYETVSGAHARNRPSLLTNATNTYQAEAECDDEAPTANRLRAVNRSFRTAVDKSFDLPQANTGDSFLKILLP